MTTIDKYLELVFPIIDYCVKESQNKDIKSSLQETIILKKLN